MADPFIQRVHTTSIAATRVKRATFALAGDGDIIALVAGRSLVICAFRVLEYNDATSCELKSNNAAGTLMWPEIDEAIGLSLDWNPEGWMATVSGEAFFLDNTGGAGPDWRGVVVYYESEK